MYIVYNIYQNKTVERKQETITQKEKKNREKLSMLQNI